MTTLCRICGRLWCDNLCHTPNCKPSCLNKLDFRKLTLDFCGTCKKEMILSFERQMARHLLPKKLRLEEEDGA